jgi:hypothetical protein
MNKDIFMTAFMYELEQKLNDNIKIFDNVKFQEDEANTDKEAKKIIKDFIINNMRKISTVKELIECDNNTKVTDSQFEVIDVLIPEELDEKDKEYVKNSKNAVYTNPDLLLIIRSNDETYREEIEVKSTKNSDIPGSSVQQIVPSVWVIFVKHSLNTIEVVTGRYINTVSGRMQFPDRSPRPQVSFDTLKKWNNEYRKFESGKLIYDEDLEANEKVRIFNDWQLLLCDRWLNMLKSDKKVKGEPWFNNNMRKFAIILINEYNKMTDLEKKSFLEKISENITENENE